MSNDDPGPDPETVERIARTAVAEEIDDARMGVDSAILALVDALDGGGDVTPEMVVEARVQLNELRRYLEDHVAPLAGAESWGEPTPHMPRGVANEIARPPGQEEADE